MESKDILNENIEKVAELFPNVLVESENGKKIDFDILRQELSDDIVDGPRERYHLDFPGKREAIIEANRKTTKTLRPIKEKSVNFDTTKNIYIEGDNLEALKILQESYLGKIKCIYIDPPYNTGNDFVYNDDFSHTDKEEQIKQGRIDENGNVITSKDINNESKGRYHSDWLKMMYPRLKLARNLLSGDGVIFISIDDNEVDNLRKLCDEVFGENNFINLICLKTKASSGASGGGEDKKLKKNCEFALFYAKDKYRTNLFRPKEKISIEKHINEHKEQGKGFYYTRILEDEGEKSFVGCLENIKIYEHKEFKFTSISNKMKEENLSLTEAYYKYFDKIFMVTNAQTSLLPKINHYINKRNRLISFEYVPTTGKDKGKNVKKYIWNETLVVWLKDSAAVNNKSVYKLDEIGTLWQDISWGRLDVESNVPFKNGIKPIKLINRLINLVENNNAIVLDFFSGSATTAHAVMKLNAEDGGNRQFIMVQLPEATDEGSEAYKSGFKNICDIGEERIRRAGKKILEEMKEIESKKSSIRIDDNGSASIEDNTVGENDRSPLDIGFRVYKIDDSNMKDIYYKPSELSQDSVLDLISNVKEGRTALDLLTQVMLNLGLTLDLKIEEKRIGDNLYYFVEDKALVACFDNKINLDTLKEALVDKPLKIVCKENCFEKDQDKINFNERIKKYSPETEKYII